ncbi:MAG: hypothetical protein ACPHYC_05295, partial [Schleiferiaceae bacterium]
MNRSQAIYEHLGRVKDPEIPVLSLHDMGILRGVDVLDDNDTRFKDAMEAFQSAHPDAPEENARFIYKITISPTYVGCPAMDR